MGKKKNKPNSSFLGKSNNSLGKDQRNIRSRVEGGVYVYHGSLTIEKLAEDLNIRATDILKELFLQGKILNINSKSTMSLSLKSVLTTDSTSKKKR